ncbi:MAG: SapC family protein [Nitrospirae bacterium]|nr:SapC family protein [Nitrospirota bacterium]
MEEQRIPPDQPLKVQPLKEEIEPLDSRKKWSCLGAACSDSCCFRFQQANIFIDEALRLASHFPLTFNAANSPDGKNNLTLSIILRPTVEKNACTYLREGEGCALGEDRPIACKQFPFCMVKGDEGEQKAVLKPSCPGFSDESGEPILLSDGSTNPVIYNECLKPAMIAAETAGETQAFVDTLVKYDLISIACCESKGLKVYLYIIDAQKLHALPKDTRDVLRAKGYMDLILAHINSAVHLRDFIDIYLDRKARQEVT